MEENNLRTDLSQLGNAIDRIRQEMSKVIIGQHEMLDLMLTSLFANGHVLLEGVPGIAKTLSAKLLAKCVGSDFSRIQFTPDLMPSDVLGTSVYNFKTSEFEFKKGPLFSNIVLIDEINRAPAKTQAALFEVMEEKQITNDGVTYAMRHPYIILATQNPIEQEGTYRLPEAQLDRFLMKIDLKYPSIEEEVKIIHRHNTQSKFTRLDEIKAVITAEELVGLMALTRHIYVEEKLMNYIAQIVATTRNNADLYLGASPRASVALLNASKAYAAINARDFVTPDDISFLAKPVLRHRVMLTPERELDGTPVDDVIQSLLKTIEIPR